MIKTDKVKVVIFSGGTGAASLLSGLKTFDSTKNAFQITSIINGYDDGASGGIVRKVMNVLCPGDLRKNQIKQHINTYGDNYSRALNEFANMRYDLTPGNELNDILKLLDTWDFEHKEMYKKLAVGFFNFPNSKKYKYDSFNVSNIIYAAMIKKIGYKATFEHFKQVFGIKDDVVLISEENYQLCGITRSGSIIDTETPGIIHRDINNIDDPIVDIFFAPFTRSRQELSRSDVDPWKDINPRPVITQSARERIEEADLIIFAPGTQWSSLIPTYKTFGLDELIKKSTAKKILLMNNTEDGDNFGQTAGDILNSVSKYLTLDDINIFINNDTPNLTLKNIDNYSGGDLCVHELPLGYDGNFCHDSYLTAKEILKFYYGVETPVFLFFDFDDTIYSRDPQHKEISESNLGLLNELGKEVHCVIVSGNDYETIHKKLVNKFGSDLSNNKILFDIWADGGVVKYENGKVVHSIGAHVLEGADMIVEGLKTFGIDESMIFLRGDWPRQDFNKLTCIGIKPLTELEKKLLINLLNGAFNSSNGLLANNTAKKIGLTGIDILRKATDKEYAFEQYMVPNNDSFYIGDELKDGNDTNISKRCAGSYNVKSPYDTHILLNLLKDEYKL